MKKKLLSMVLTLALALSFFALPVSAAKAPVSEGKKLYVTGTKNFLALRSKPEYNDANIKRKLYNGQKVKITGGWKGKYVKVYSYKTKKSGYVDGTYLTMKKGKIKTVRNVKNFLALRTSAKESDANIFGKMYNGDKVRVIGNTRGSYVWIYSFALNRSGYVNKNYIK